MASPQFLPQPEPQAGGLPVPNGHAGFVSPASSGQTHTVRADLHHGDADRPGLTEPVQQHTHEPEPVQQLTPEPEPVQQHTPEPEPALPDNRTSDPNVKETQIPNTNLSTTITTNDKNNHDNDTEQIDPPGEEGMDEGGSRAVPRLKNLNSAADSPKWYLSPITEVPQNGGHRSLDSFTAGAHAVRNNVPSHASSFNGYSYSDTYSTYEAGFAGRGRRHGGKGVEGDGGGGGGGAGNPGLRNLTVEGTWKADTEMEKQGRKKSSIWLMVAVKWMVTVFIFAVLLACLVAVKISVIVLCTRLSENVPQDYDNQLQWRKYSAHFNLVYLYLTIPPFLMFLRASWNGILSKKVPWPRRKAVLAAVVSAALESAGLCLLCYSVLGGGGGAGGGGAAGGGGGLKPPVAVLLLSSLLLVPAVNTIFIVRTLRRLRRAGIATIVLVVLGVLCYVIGFGLVAVILYRTVTPDHRIWHPIVAVVCLSVAWMPSLQHYISISRKTTTNTGGGNGRATTPYGSNDNTATLNSTVTTTNTMSGTQDSTFTNTGLTTATAASGAEDSAGRKRSGDLSSNAAWKTAVIVNGSRVAFTFIASFFLFTLDSGSDDGTAFSGLVHRAWLDSWDLGFYTEDDCWAAFGTGLGGGLLAYALAFAACHANMARGAFAAPLLLAMPLSLVGVAVRPLCESFFLLPAPPGGGGACSSWAESDTELLVPAAVFLALGHLLAFGWSLFRVDSILLQQECVIFCVPGYNGVALDTWLTVNRRRDVSPRKSARKKPAKKTKVFICTTMYREDDSEMRQLLKSIRRINEASTEGDHQFESHIIFDNGVHQREPTEFALRLICLLDETLDVEAGVCTKLVTPYGLKLSWALPGPSGQKMPFNIHLKDNLLVKNKKRWSQVMYMSYVLDFLIYDDEDSFILTTDADVVFTPDSVEALLDLMTRDNSIGAVCARTHPMGSGPLVWYQVFEYAIGHWFQKAAEHVLGSVLCAPGCFSVYRCRSLADVLPKYAKRVENAFDFLTKDMGEDRWLCTLLVQSGWRIEYCAASENRTNCPSQFEEFYKQRRRWIASTLANLMLILQEYQYILALNHRVSAVFLFYQGLLLLSTLIGPSTVILVVTGGVSYAWEVEVITPVLLQVLACVAYAGLCVFTAQSTQLKVAKLYTFLYAVIMTAVVVGVAEQVVTDLNAKDSPGPSSPGPGNGTASSTTTLAPSQHISMDLPMSVTTLYLSILIGIFLTAGLLHPREFGCLFHGLWYLLCLPSGYLVLTIYSICNITDSSWGTREQAAEKSSVKQKPWQEKVQDLFYDVFFCCPRRGGPDTKVDAEVQTVAVIHRSTSEDRPHTSSMSSDVANPAPSWAAESDSHEEPVDDEIPFKTEPVPVEEWLPQEMRGPYAHLFRKHGFDSTLFIAGMTGTELRRIGVTSQVHQHHLLAQIKLIPAFDIEYKVPTDLDGWLEEIGLSMYRDNFWRNHIRKPKQMEILKSFGRKEIQRELNIVKDGHIKRLLVAICKLRNPTAAQQKAIRMRQVIEGAPLHQLRESNVDENAFWDRLKQKCLAPDLEAFGHEGEVKVKLAELRTNWLMIIAVSNSLWLVLISTLASNTDLNVYHTNPLSLVFLVVFGLIFTIQFFAMLVHRLYTLSHFLARAPYRCGRPISALTDSWETGDFEESVDRAALAQVKEGARSAWERVNRTKSRRRGRSRAFSNPGAGEQSTETIPLLEEVPSLDFASQARVI